MGKIVSVKPGYTAVSLPSGNFNQNESTTLTDAEYAGLTAPTLAAITVTNPSVTDPVRNSSYPVSLYDALTQAKAYTDTHGVVGGGAVSSVAGRTGAVTLSFADIGGTATSGQVPAAPVSSVAGKTGAVSLAFSDITGTATSGQVPAAPVSSVAGKTGAVTLGFSDITGTATVSQLPVFTGTIAIYGQGAPVNNVTGLDGDYYEDLNSGIIYGPRTSGAWTAYTSSARRIIPTSVKTGSYTLSSGDLVLVDASANNVVITVPAGLPTNAVWGVKIVNLVSPYKATVNLSGSDVFNRAGGSTTLNLPLNDQMITAEYQGSNIHLLETSRVPLSQLDNRFLAQPAQFITNAYAAHGMDAYLAKARAAIAGTGICNYAFIGDSITAGQAAAPQTDAVAYGWVGRLKSMLIADGMPLAQEFFVPSGADPRNLTLPTGPYSALMGTISAFSGGVGAVWIPGDNTSWMLTITVPATATSLDLITVDYVASSTWQYAVDGAAAVTVTCGATNVGIANGATRRTNIPVTPGSTHTITIGKQSVANGLLFAGHAVYTGTTGAGFARAGIPGWLGVDFTTGTGTTAGRNAGPSVGPDLILPWSGVQNTNNAAGSGFPFSPDVAVITLGTNDCSYLAMVEAFERALVRYVHSFRRGNPNCLVLIQSAAYPTRYSDAQAIGGNPDQWQRYKVAQQGVAARYGCVFVDSDSSFGETPVANGYMINTDIHPTSNGSGTGGGDGHLRMAQLVHSVLNPNLY